MQQSAEQAARAALSIREFAQRSGYSEAKVRRAMRQLSISGQFQGRGKATLLGVDDQQRIALQIDELELQGEQSATVPGLLQPFGQAEGQPPAAAGVARSPQQPEEPGFASSVEPRFKPAPAALSAAQAPEQAPGLTYDSPFDLTYTPQPSAPEPHSPMSNYPPPNAQIEVSTGNHRQVLENPALPDRYDLAQFRSTETISTLADPGAIAAQAMGAIDALVNSMESDIQQQQAHLQETQRAAHTLRLKAKQLQDKKIEYMIQSSTLGQAQQQTTLELQEALEEIQSLGKSPSDGPKSPSPSH